MHPAWLPMSRTFRCSAVLALSTLPANVNGAAKVFDPGLGLDMQNTCVMITILVIFTIIIDSLTEKLEDVLQGHHPQFKTLVAKVYKEIVSDEYCLTCSTCALATDGPTVLYALLLSSPHVR